MPTISHPEESQIEDHHELKAARAGVKPCLQNQTQTEAVALLAAWLPGRHKALALTSSTT